MLAPLLLVLVSEDPEVVVVDPDGPLISVVDNGGVEVTVSVVVAVVVVAAADENEGSTKSVAGAGSSLPPVTNMTAPTRIAMRATPAALAPTTALVEWCQGSSWGSSPATASDISRATCADAGSAELGHHLGCDQLEVVEVRDIQ